MWRRQRCGYGGNQGTGDHPPAGDLPPDHSYAPNPDAYHLWDHYAFYPPHPVQSLYNLNEPGPAAGMYDYPMPGFHHSYGTGGWGEPMPYYGYQGYSDGYLPYYMCYGNNGSWEADVPAFLPPPPPILSYVGAGPIVTPGGIITVVLRHLVRVDVTTDKSIRIHLMPGVVAAINAKGDVSCVTHPSGKSLQEGVNVYVQSEGRKAKISNRGITFTSSQHSLVYLVDASGTKTTTERFKELQGDRTAELFFKNCADHVQQSISAVHQAGHRTLRNGSEVWTVAGLRIQQTPWGDVRVSRDYGRRVVRASPSRGTLSVSTPFVHVAASCDPHRLFYVRRGEKRITRNAAGFHVRNGTQKAGFDSKGMLTLR